MATCSFCDQEMREAESCTKNAIVDDGRVFEPVVYGDEDDWSTNDRCHDCGIEPGGYHHPGCDVERHPATGQQLLMMVLSDDPETPRHARIEPDPHVDISLPDGDSP